MSTIDLFAISHIEIIYRRKVKASLRPKVKRGKEAYCLFRDNWDDGRMALVEDFKILLLDRNAACMGICAIASGGIDGILVDKRLIFATALKARAVYLVLGHNHPSGNLTPSKADIRLTADIYEAGQLLNIPVRDHIILTDEGYTSFSEEGIRPF